MRSASSLCCASELFGVVVQIDVVDVGDLAQGVREGLALLFVAQVDEKRQVEPLALVDGSEVDQLVFLTVLV